MVEDGFELGEPALVCRWRMAGRHIPLLNRHVRALSERTVNGGLVGRGLLGWVKQHIEWALAEDATIAPGGVLMLVVDRSGRAAMSAGPYEPLADASVPALARRALDARREAAETGIAPEALAAVRGGALVLGIGEGERASGAVSLAEQLARTHGIAVERDVSLAAAFAAGDACPAADAVLLISDEHGVVTAAPGGDAGGVAAFLADGYARLLDAAR